eukprot:12658915-Alexandrium_andersonii.AAC.1
MHAHAASAVHAYTQVRLRGREHARARACACARVWISAWGAFAHALQHVPGGPGSRAVGRSRWLTALCC